MKKAFTYLCLALVCIVTSVSCNKAALDKDAVEAGFAAKGPVPSVSIDKNISVDITVATVKVTFAGITTESSDSLSIGLLTSSDPSFYKSSFAPAEKLADGTYEIECTVEPNATMYFRGVAANINGTNYSETVSMKIPDVPFYAKVGGVYACAKEFSEAYGDEYPGHSITIIVDPEDNTSCIVANIEPYYASKGNVYTKGYNYCVGVVDNDNKTITIPMGTDVHLGGRVMSAGNAVSFAEATGYADIVLQMQEDGSLVRTNCLLTITPSGVEDAYKGGVVFRK